MKTNARIYGRWAALAAFFVFLPLPILLLNGYYFYSAWLILYYMVLAVGWNMGLLGNVISLANYGYAGIGAYAYALAVTHGGSFAVAILLSAAVPTLAMLPVTFLLRLKSMYFSVATFVVPLIVTGIINLLPDLTGGGTGVYIPISKTLSQIQAYVIVAVVAAVSVSFTAYLIWSKYGLALRSIYDAEDAAAANGVNATGLRFMVFLVPAPLAGMAGAALASSLSFLDTSVVFNVGDLLILILITLIGGSRSVFGPVVGAVFVTVMVLALNIYFPYSHLAVLGLIVLAITLGRPALARYLPAARSLFSKERTKIC